MSQPFYVLTRLLAALLLLGLCPGFAFAHNIDFTWKSVGEQLLIEAFFDDDTPALAARVQILDEEGRIMASAVTDGQGKCTLPAPNPGKYHLVVDAGAGHRKERPIVIGDSSSGGVKRSDFTRFPWVRIAIGLGVIGAVAGAFLWSRRGRPPLAA
jgi:hypothetical protein